MTDFTKRLVLTIEDAGGDKSPVSIHIGDSDTGGVEDENSFLNDYLIPLWNVIKPIVTGVLVSASVVVDYPLDSFSNNTPSALSDIEEKVVFELRPCDRTARMVRLSLPTVKETIFENLGAGKHVDFTNSDVIAFVLLLTNSVADGGIDARDSHANDICSVVDGIALWKG